MWQTSRKFLTNSMALQGNEVRGMENEKQDETGVNSLEELKEMIRALPEGMVLSLAMEEGRNGERAGISP